MCKRKDNDICLWITKFIHILMLAQKWNLGEKCMEKGIALQFHLCKKILMNNIYYLFKWKWLPAWIERVLLKSIDNFST